MQTKQATADAGHCPRVLVVDDVQDNLDLVREVFAPEPWNVRTAASAQEAWTILDKWRPDVVLLDIQMPVFTGHHLCAAMNRKPALDDIPVMFLTAEHVAPGDVQRGVNAGAADYICKPIDGRELRARVRTVLAQHPRPRPPVGA